LSDTAGDTVADWMALVENLYPARHVATWDNVGLQVGDPSWPVERVLVTLDVTPAVIEEASHGPRTLVLAHHPLLFRPLPSVTPSTASGRTALLAASRSIAIAAAHTNLDVATDGAGTSDPVARLLDLQDVRPLTTETAEGRRVKLVVFVPPGDVDRVLDAVAAAGAGTIGDYDRCSFQVPGTGTFLPRQGTDPHVGDVGTDNVVDEIRLEVELPSTRTGDVVRALRDAHPYEEVAFDLYQVIDAPGHGFGRLGTLPSPMPLRAVAAAIRDRLPAPHLRFAGEPDRLIRTLAVVGGAGDGLIGAAAASGVDCYVTGDLRHHVTIDALTQGITLIDAGHHATEVAALPSWVTRLEQAAGPRNLSARVVASAVDTVPWAR